MPELIVAQTALADSLDVIIGTGGSATFLLKGGVTDAIPATAIALIQAKNAAGTQYVTIGQIDAGNPIRVLSAAGTFRVRKLLTTSAIGVDQN